MVARTLLLVAAALGPLAGCSGAFSPRPCAVDGDCGDALVCGERDGKGVCLTPEDAPLYVGMSGPVSGPSQELGVEVKRGITLALEAQNAAGGVRGRRVVLDFRDDAYQPPLAEK